MSRKGCQQTLIQMMADQAHVNQLTIVWLSDHIAQTLHLQLMVLASAWHTQYNSCVRIFPRSIVSCRQAWVSCRQAWGHICGRCEGVVCGFLAILLSLTKAIMSNIMRIPIIATSAGDKYHYLTTMTVSASSSTDLVQITTQAQFMITRFPEFIPRPYGYSFVVVSFFFLAPYAFSHFKHFPHSYLSSA